MSNTQSNYLNQQLIEIKTNIDGLLHRIDNLEVCDAFEIAAFLKRKAEKLYLTELQ